MLRRVWPAEPFDRAVAIFFGLVLLALGIATITNAPLSYDGAFYLFRVLDSNRFSAAHGRLINLPLQLPVWVALHLTQDLGVLRLTYCAAYASIPVLALALSWWVCKSRRPALFIWPAMSICIAGLPGQFFFEGESIMAVTLLWPALLAVLVEAPAAVLPWVAIASIGAVFSHLYAAPVLALIVSLAIISAIVRPESRKLSLGLAVGLGVLLLARILMPLDPYESHAASVQTIVMSLRNAVIGWPLVAVALTMVAALSCLFATRSRMYLMVPLILAGAVMVVWASRPAAWALCLDYRYWVAPVSLPLMAGAAAEELWLRRSPEPRWQEIRRYAVGLIGAIFFLVLSIQSLQWGVVSRRLSNELMNYDHGCISPRTLTSVRNDALDFWSLGVYAVDLQSRKPRTLVLAHKFACRLFALDGDAILIDNGNFTYVRHRGEGWFDFEDARSRTDKPGNRLPPVPNQ